MICEAVTAPCSNGMKFQAFDEQDNLIKEEIYFSIGGGTVVRQDELDQKHTVQHDVPYPFNSCSELIQQCTSDSAYNTILHFHCL